MPGPDLRSPFSYLVLRVVPSLERGERLNVGVVVFCRQRDFLGARVNVDGNRLRALGGEPAADPDRLAEVLEAIVRVAEGDPDAGPIAALPASDRFGWLAAPSSTVIQPSEVHTGLCADPAATLCGLEARLVSGR